ncbi:MULTISPECIES: hypothetical protein [Rhizobium]|uniref:hypothetical protein n=1 Tax=Rhizobium TaxID=379 RepID=UPI001FEE14F8|nr:MULTISPECIES: hypothetical protein [Rhizobium]
MQNPAPQSFIAALTQPFDSKAGNWMKQRPSTDAEQLKSAALIDDIADQMTREGVETALADRYAALSDDTRYEEDEYKFNPFGGRE